MQPNHSPCSPERPRSLPPPARCAPASTSQSVIVQKDASGSGRALARAAVRVANASACRFRNHQYETGKARDAARQNVWTSLPGGGPGARDRHRVHRAVCSVEGTYLVRRDSPLKSITDFDRKGVRVAVGDKTAYDLYLTRNLKNAELVRSSSSIAAIEQFKNEKLDAAAGVKQPLVWAAEKDPGLRVIDGNFMVIRQAAGVPKGRSVAARYFNDFIEEMKASGFVAEALRRSNQPDAAVAPAAK